MGLHNRFPSYFYKRGNLFNTYLGYTDSEAAMPSNAKSKTSAAQGRPTRLPSKVGHAAFGSGGRSDDRAGEAGARLAAFARGNLSAAETDRLLHLIASRAGVPLRGDEMYGWRLPMQLGHFVAEHVPADVAMSYLRVLEQRLAHGEPLIRK